MNDIQQTIKREMPDYNVVSYKDNPNGAVFVTVSPKNQPEITKVVLVKDNKIVLKQG